MTQIETTTEDVALDALAHQLGSLDKTKTLEQLKQPIDSILGIALSSKNEQAKQKSLEILGKYLGIKHSKETTAKETVESQIEAAEAITAIAFSTDNEDTRTKAIDALDHGLYVTTIIPWNKDEHTKIVTDMGAIAVNSTEPVKNSAIKALSIYSERKQESFGGSKGGLVNPESQKLATELIGAIAI